MLGLRFVSSLICAALLMFSTASAQTVRDHLGPLEATIGQKGVWDASLQGGWFLLTNRQDDGSIRYFSTEGPKLTAGTRTIKSTVIVLPEAGKNAYGGILFDHAGDAGYFAFTVSGDGRVILWDRTPDGFKDLVAENVTAKMDGSDVLEVRETPTRTTFHINGEEVFNSTNENGFNPTYGIIAIGAGRFGFDGYSVDLQQGASPLPAPGGGGTAELPKPGGGGQVAEAPLPTPGGGGTGGGGQQPTPQPGGGGNPFENATPEDIYASKVILGTTLGIFFHEFGHALIGETKLPATGPEEDVADGFSAFVLSSTVTEGGLDPQMQEFFTDVVKYSSLLWYYQGKSMEASGKKLPWQDEHAPDLKRFRNSFCIIYGSDPDRYEQLANQVQLGDRTKYRCKLDYKKRYDAWETILKTVARDLGPDSPGVYPADTPGGKLNLTFIESNDPYGNAVEALLRDTGTLDSILKGLQQMFVWPRDVQVEFRDCQEINAWYDPQAGKVTMCYSLVKHTSELVFNIEGKGGLGQGGGGGGTQPDPGGNQSDEASKFLVGLWGTQIQGQGGAEQALAQIDPNGSYTLQRSGGGAVYTEQGSWQAQLAGQNKIQLRQVPTAAQLCDQSNQCQPITAEAATIVVDVMDQNRISTEGIVWQRQK